MGYLNIANSQRFISVFAYMHTIFWQNTALIASLPKKRAAPDALPEQACGIKG
jgi:hypothetical protein